MSSWWLAGLPAGRELANRLAFLIRRPWDERRQYDVPWLATLLRRELGIPAVGR
jgi:hypothetical protein